jgi:DNA-binding NarL/FixJ family response regulator
MVLGVLKISEAPVTVSELRPAEVAVSVLADDRTFADQVVPSLRAAAELRLLSPGRHSDADVVLVLTSLVTDTLLAEMTEIAGGTADQTGPCLVLVSGPLRERHLARAIACGVVSILPRRDVSARSITRAVLASHHGGSVLPETVVRWLVDDSRTLRQDLLATQGLNPGGLTIREVDVLKLLAEGEDTARIAERLRYSERTIKKIIQDLLTRFNLRNRAHAVSYALRVGAF